MQDLRAVERFADRKRAARAGLLVRLVGLLPQPIRMLDVGGTVDYWRALGFPLDSTAEIVLFNVFEQVPARGFTCVVGDACDLSRYRDNEFDVVFSNSVLGHVGSLERQQQMAREIRRVGRHYFVQTPDHGFPIDWRTLVPFFHRLPTEAQAWCFERWRVGRYHRARDRKEALEWATRVRNVRSSELLVLFPKASVVRERVLGFTKSFIAHNFEAPTNCL